MKIQHLAGTFLAAALAVPAVMSCNQYPLTPLGDTLSAVVNDTSDPLGSNAVDILWVVDNSGSMREEQAELAAKFNAFVGALVSIGADFRMAVITTDTRAASARGRFQDAPGRFLQRNCQATSDELAAECGDLSLDQPFLNVSNYRNGTTVDVDRLQRDFRCIASVGDCGNPYEEGLGALGLAIAPNMIASDGVNSGFFREDAFLAVIFLTDEDDCSFGGAFDPATDSQCYTSNTRPNMVPVETYYNALVELKGGDPSRVLLAGIIGPSDGRELQEAGPDYQVVISCNSALGGTGGTQSARDGRRYRDFIELAGERGIEESICQGDYTVALRKIGEIIRASLDVVCIDSPPQTCSNSRDCGAGVDCINPGDPIDGSQFCADFEIALEVSTPESPGIFSPYVGPGAVGDTINPATQFEVDYDAVACPRGVAFSFSDNQRPRPGSRYRISYPVNVDLISAEDGTDTVEE